MSAEVEKRREEAANNLRDSAVVAWVTKSFQNRRPEEQISLPQAIAFAKSRDSAQLFDVVAEPGTGMTQICVVAAAAMAIRFSDDVNELDWGWSIMDRVDGMTERGSQWQHSNNPYDPRLFYMVTLKRDIAGETPKAVSAARLLTLAGNPNWQIAQCALTALLDATALPPPLVWNAAILASELSLNHRGSMNTGCPINRCRKPIAPRRRTAR